MPKGKVLATPANAAKRWGTNLSNAAAKITEGVKNVQSSPGEDAAKAKAAWIAAMTSAAVQNKWAENVAKVSLSEWQERMTSKGIPAIANAVQNGGEAKFQKAMAKILPAIQSTLDSLPKNRATFQARITRVTQYLTKMHSLKGTLGAND